MGTVAAPPKEDAGIVARMAEIGIVPGQKFEMSKLGPDIRKALKDMPKLVTDKLNYEGRRLLAGLRPYQWDRRPRAVRSASHRRVRQPRGANPRLAEELSAGVQKGRSTNSRPVRF